jgi:hypothetical protein
MYENDYVEMQTEENDENKSKINWDEWTCTFAAMNGHINVIDWVRDKGCPWDEMTFAYAAKYNRFDTLKYLFEQKCPYDEITHAYALVGYPKPDDKVINWIVNNGFPKYVPIVYIDY